MLVGDLRRDQSKDLRIDVDLLQVDGRDPVLLRQHAGQLFFGHRIGLHERIPESSPLSAGFLQAFAELLLRDQPFANEEVAEAILNEIRRHRKHLVRGRVRALPTVRDS